MLFTITLVSILFSLIAAYLWTINNRYNYFKRHGIPGPPPRFFFGHYKTLWSTKSFSKLIEQWTRQYGSIYGIFQGSRPTYIVSDVDFLQEVYIKQFTSFHSRDIAPIFREENDGKINLFRAFGARWRRQRHLINPTFSSTKLKQMSSLMNGCIEAMLDKLSQVVNSEEKEINIYELYKRLTMDVICRCAFGIDTDMQNDIDNPYLQKSIEVFKVDPEQLLILKLSNLMPFLSRPLHDILFSLGDIHKFLTKWMPPLTRYIHELPDIWLMNRVQDVISLRTKSPPNLSKRVDLLQLMMDVSTSVKVIDDPNDQHMSKVLHTDETLSNIYIFMVAGFETTSTTLAYSTYVLATKPEIQDKLVDEIDQHDWNNFNEGDAYETANNLSYLDLFLREVLRMYPVTVKVMGRECNTTTVVCDHTVEKGSIIQPDIFTIHYNPDLWGPEDPNIFIPERHKVKRHPLAWMPFGVGPRNCVGMKFALMELKMCLIQLLRQYRILAGDKIEVGFNRRETIVIQPNAIFVKLEKRSV